MKINYEGIIKYNENWSKKLHDYIRNDLKDIPFDKALPFLQNKLWEIADKHGTTGDKVFGALMDNWKDF